MDYKVRHVVFDFNGTLFHDTSLHTEAWVKTSAKYSKTPFTAEIVEAKLMGLTNHDIVAVLLQKAPSKNEVDTIGQEKEEYYRSLVSSVKGGPHLVSSAEAVFMFLQQHGISYTIATSSEINNLKFFTGIFQLEQWFDLKKIVYDNGCYPGKPAPDIYLKAMEVLGARPDDTLVFEDAVSGLKAARDAGIERRVVINTIDFNHHLPERLAWKKITSFEEVLHEPEKFFH